MKSFSLFTQNIPVFIKYSVIHLLSILILFPTITYSASNDQKESVMFSVDTLGEKEVPSEPVSEENLSIKIGVIDIQQVLDESQKGKEARRYYEGLTSLRSMEELARTEEELINQIMQDIEIIVEEYAKRNKFTHIIDNLEGGILYVDEAFVLTDKIIELYDAKVRTSQPGEK
ncbi:MAG: OmpH family outer membrane protein [Thermodesulfobacteriota bacterium]